MSQVSGYRFKGMRVSFFIIGAPKCGTTALSAYLGTHPHIRFCNPKELYYFSPELNLTGQKIAGSVKEYHELFGEGADLFTTGEGSVSYLLSETAVPLILKYNPSARFIVMLREPAQMLYSWHNQLVLNMLEREWFFESAWRAQGLREQGRGLQSIPNVSPEIFKWKQWVSYGSLLERLYLTVPKEQCKVILFDDFKEKTAEIYREVLSFLRLPDDGRDEFNPVNQSRRIRSGFKNIIRLNEKLTPECRRGIKKMIRKVFRVEMDGRFDQFTKPEAVRLPLADALRDEINETMRSEIEKAADIAGRDLSRWLPPRK